MHQADLRALFLFSYVTGGNIKPPVCNVILKAEQEIGRDDESVIVCVCAAAASLQFCAIYYHGLEHGLRYHMCMGTFIDFTHLCDFKNKPYTRT